MLLWIFTDTSYPAYRRHIIKECACGDVRRASNIRFDGDVYLFASGYTISAAERFLSCREPNNRSRSSVSGRQDFQTRLTEAAGNFPHLERTVLEHERRAVEGLGIDPDIRVATSVEAAREGFDPVLDAVLRLIEEGE